MTAFSKKLAEVAIEQYFKYRYMREQETALSKQIELYWQGIANFPGVSTAWSAVFISWCVKQAGASATEFHFSSRHSTFVHWAIQNQLNNAGLFKAHEIKNYAPKVGDILQNNRSGNRFGYAYAKANRKYESHSAIVIEVGADSKGNYLRTIGGNENDSVGMKEVRLDPKGFVKNANGIYISIIESLK